MPALVIAKLVKAAVEVILRPPFIAIQNVAS
jgi:hypothetical protein